LGFEIISLQIPKTLSSNAARLWLTALMNRNTGYRYADRLGNAE